MARKSNKPEHRINSINLAKYVAKAQKGNQKALEHIVNETGDYIYYYCLTLLKNEDDACEAVQDIYVILLEKLKTLENPQTFLGWLKVITSNYCKNRLSRRPHTVSIEESEITEFTEDKDSQIMPGECLEAEEISRIIMSVVKQLPDIHKECVLMYYYHQFSVEQISTVLGVKEGTVKSRLYYARKAIKAELEKYGKENLTFDGFSPLLYITGSLLFESENCRFTIPSQNIISAKSIIHTENAIDAGATLSSAVRLIPVTVAKTSIVAKVIAGVGIVTAGVIVTGSVVVYTVKNTDIESDSISLMNVEMVATQMTTVENSLAEQMFYANGFEDEDRRSRLVYDESELNSESNKNYIYDLMSNAIDSYKTVQGTYFYEDPSLCYYSSYFFNLEGEVVSKEITCDCEGVLMDCSIYNGMYSQVIPYFESADSTKQGTFSEQICNEMIAQRESLFSDEVKELSNVFARSYCDCTALKKADFVALAASKNRYKQVDGEYTSFFREDYARLQLSDEQYFPQIRAYNYLYNFDNWEITDDSATVKYVPDRSCFAISGEADGVNGVYSFKMLVDRETGALIYFSGNDVNGNDSTVLITYEFKVDGQLNDKVTSEIKEMLPGEESEMYAVE